jgi:hypothetical protein
MRLEECFINTKTSDWLRRKAPAGYASADFQAGGPVKDLPLQIESGFSRLSRPTDYAVMVFLGGKR